MTQHHSVLHIQAFTRHVSRPHCGHHSLYMRRRLYTLVSPQSAPYHRATAPFTETIPNRFFAFWKFFSLLWTTAKRRNDSNLSCGAYRVPVSSSTRALKKNTHTHTLIAHWRWLIKCSTYRKLKDYLSEFLSSRKSDSKVVSWIVRRTILCGQGFTMTISL